MFYYRTIRCLIASFCLIYTLIATFSCAPQREVIDKHLTIERFKFLQNGKTDKQEIIDRLGEPPSSYENGRIVIYYWRSEELKIYHVVLVFNEGNVLKRHSIVRVR